MKVIFKSAISLMSSFFIYLLGGFDVALEAFLIVIVLDYITGILSAIHNNNLNSDICFNGIIKKICYLIIITLSVVMDKISGHTGMIRTVVIYFFVGNDSISIIENIGKMGIKLPTKIIECFEQLKKEG